MFHKFDSMFYPLKRNHWDAYARLMRLDKPVGTFLLLWPTLWAFWIASYEVFSIKLLFIFITGVFVMRSAGCVINDMVDRKIDPHVVRTANRPLACAEIPLEEAQSLLLILILIAFGLVLFLNWLCFGLACISLLITFIYPYTKRWIVAPQCILGIAFSLGIPMAFVAIDGDFSKMPWLLWGIGLLWPVIYDTLYAMVDKEDDLKIGIHSTAILFGKKDIYIVIFMEVVWFMMWVVLGSQLDLNILFYVSIIVVFRLCLYHGKKCLQLRDKVSKTAYGKACFNAFLSHIWVGGILLTGLILGKITLAS